MPDLFDPQAADPADPTNAVSLSSCAERTYLECALSVGAPADGFTLVEALLRPERRGRHHEIVKQRKRLRALSAPLFQAHMATR